MSSRLCDLSAHISGYIGITAFVAGFVILKLTQRFKKLDAIPTVGPRGWLGSWWAGLTYLTNALDVIQEGYEKHKKAPFKIAAPHGWLVVLSSTEHLEDVRTAPEDTLSFLEGINEEFQVEYTMGYSVHHNPYHIPILRSHLTRNLVALYSAVRNEIITAFDDILDLEGNEWKSVSALPAMQKIVCRASNRVFIGLPLCRDPEWMDLCVQYAIYVVKGAMTIKQFPTFMKPLAAWLFTNIVQSNERGRKLLGPIIGERQGYLKEYGEDWAEKPNDLLAWLMDEAKGDETTVEALTYRILANNFAAIDTSATSFTNALFYLAANPQYIQPLREEVETTVGKEGWSKASLDKMRKVDSFLKESERMEGFNGVTLIRQAMRDVTLSDGTFIPKGTKVAAPTRSIHYDEAIYPNAHAFAPFRFSDAQEADAEGGKYHYTTATTEYLAFGLGRPVCPGRFFAANELKSMLAHVVVTYDVKLGGNASRPKMIRIGTSMRPDPDAKVMFRRRVD